MSKPRILRTLMARNKRHAFFNGCARAVIPTVGIAGIATSAWLFLNGSPAEGYEVLLATATTVVDRCVPKGLIRDNNPGGECPKPPERFEPDNPSRELKDDG